MTDVILKKHRGTMGAEVGTLFEFIQTAAHNLENLMSGLRSYSRIIGVPSTQRLCDMNDILAAALVCIRPAIIESGAEVTHEPLPELHCDPSQMTYVFTAMIDNAIKFRGEDRPAIHLSATSGPGDWIVSVRDNGIGIDPGYRDRIFSPFKRIHYDAFPGAGVGLAIVKRILELHNGRTWVDSNPGPGVTFCFSIPNR
jgi:light-regulated signal transduction histidine kinase (bacteriophytochrome)